MKKINLTWTWKLGSPLHQGSGLSQPGTADSLIVRDGDGKPYITGDAVKGALRMSAEHILAWQNHDQSGHYADTTKSAEPHHPLLKSIFGGEAQAHFSPGTISEENQVIATIAQTAIEQKSGTALDNSLRIIEMLCGAEVTSNCTVWVNSEEKAVAAFLLASLLATDWIGGRTGSGWGQLSVDEPAITINDTSIQPTELLNTTILDFNAVPSSVSQNAANRHNKLGTVTEWQKVALTITETTCIGSKPALSNSVETLDFIPATTIRGACYAAWKREGKTDEEIRTLLGDTYRWTPALPTDEKGTIAVPIPLSWLTPKGAEGIGSVYDALSGKAPPGNDEIQWKKPSGRWIDCSGSKLVKPLRETTMHSARDYTTGSKRKGALFTREHLSASEKVFYFWVKLPSEVELPKALTLGKRNSAGHGLATVNVVDKIGATFSENSEPGYCIVQLLSPVIVRGENGLPLRSLNGAAWTELLGCAVSVANSVSANRNIPGWMSTWKHGRAAVAAIEAGSVWKLKPGDGKTVTDLRKALKDLEERGLGERTHEGFGWIAVDPAWMTTKADIEEDKTGAEDPPVWPWPKPHETAKVKPWKGFPEDQDVGELEEIVASVKKLEGLLQNLQSPLQILAVKARESTISPLMLLKYIDKFTKRNKPGKWEVLKKPEKKEDKPAPVRDFLESNKVTKDIKYVCFAVEALLIQAGKEKQA